MAVTVTARSWLQSAFRAPVAGTIRLTVLGGGGGNYDWSVTLGTAWDSLDDLIAAWNTALAGAATVVITPAIEIHKARLVITTGTGGNYTITWSQAGDGTAIRDRLGATGDIASHTSGTDAWNGTVVGAFYSWVGFGRMVRTRTGLDAIAAKMMNGTVVSQHDRDGGSEPIEASLLLRWGFPPGGSARMLGHFAIEDFFTDLYSADNTPSDTFAVYHLASADAERWLVRLADDRVELRPVALAGGAYLSPFEMPIQVDVIEAAT